MIIPDSLYGPATANDIGAVARLARQGFGLPREIFDRYAALFGTDTIRCLRRDGAAPLSACAAWWRMDQWFGGRPVPSQGVAMVAVDPAARGTGAGSSLMRSLLAEGRAADAAVSVLHPSTLPFYRRLGFGRGGVSCDWSAAPAALAGARRDAGLEGTVVPADPLDAAPLARLRQALLATGNGLPERNEALWTLALCPDGEPSDLFLLGGPDGSPEGYVAVAPPKDQRLIVADLCTPTARSTRLALRVLAGYRAQVDRIAWRGGPDDPLALLAEDVGVRMDGREEWLVRVLDVERALATRGYPTDAKDSIAFEINDSLFSENCRCFHLQVEDGFGVIASPTRDETPVATLGIAAFSSLFSGHASARALRQTGMLHGEDAAAERLDRLFGGARPWMPDRF
ncbi:enhanced intracellular survival protein Eis [Azospirillum doebereinerae]|uniref:GNAT family N-acetyltransferase n=1 Tax=Azospirillum doebereinerae TaxID=92933 RepID=UPI001EE60CB5|nr:GNAT family N-acetyltransferase [Azospirillum doebereinerae]MCG5240804.1 GNAT family N-acetyltransferase [Azospirillum doebereinerae]